MAIYEKVRELTNEAVRLGYVEEEEDWYHSERLTLAARVVNGPATEGKASRVLKNTYTIRKKKEFLHIISQ